MTRIARIVVPGQPHHITQRGNRREQVFFHEKDCEIYLRILKEQIALNGVQIWAYCLMDNHVHLVAVPLREDSLARCMAETHRQYTRYFNKRNGWTGHIWQGRFNSFPLEGNHVLAAIRYVERNPVRASIVQKAEDYAWSSAKHHVLGNADPLIADHPLRAAISDWAAFLAEGDQPDMTDDIKKHARTGRPMGDASFLSKLEKQFGRDLSIKKVGRKKQTDIAGGKPPANDEIGSLF